MISTGSKHLAFMKRLSTTVAGLTLAALLTAPVLTFAADKAPEKEAVKKTAKPKAYPMKTCVVTDEKLGGDMGEPYVFAYKDREIKLCCKDCRKDFEKEPAKYLKKIEAAEKKAAENKALEKK
jgi:hypothetical protein